MNSTASKISLIGLPYDENSSFLKGAALAPPLIREALYSDSSNLFTEVGIELNENTVFDAGDLSKDAKDPHAEIVGAISSLLSKNFIPIALGGDHSVTYSVVTAFRKRFARLSVVQFDAHSDTYDVFQGNRMSHACPFARIMEETLADRLVQVGIRTLNDHQRSQVSKFGVEVLEMKDWSQVSLLEFDSPVYISVDMDVLDPAFAPGISHYEPGGASTRMLVDSIQSLKCELVGADIVEYNPKRDSLGITAMVCAKLIKELGARMLI